MKSNKRILFVHLGYAFGGIEVYMKNLAGLLKNEAELFAVCSHPELISRLRAESVNVIELPMIETWLRPIRFVLIALMLPYLILRYGIDIVQINGYWEATLLLPARLLGCIAISARHLVYDVEVKRWYRSPKRILAKLIYNTNAKFATRVICVSEAVATEVRTIVDPKRVIVIPNWISNIPEYRVRPKLEDRPVRLLFIGRMVIFKGLHIVLDAIRGLSNIELTVVGEGPLRSELEAKAKGLNARFVGFQSNVTRFYEAADLFVMPSIGLEGLPLVSLEAMGHGIPCIFSDLPVHREITEDGKTAVLFRAGDAPDLQAKLSEVIAALHSGTDDKTAAAYESVKTRYSTRAARHSYLKAFELVSDAVTTAHATVNAPPVQISPVRTCNPEPRQ